MERNDSSLNLRIPRDMADELHLVAMGNGRTVSVEVREAIAAYLRDNAHSHNRVMGYCSTCEIARVFLDGRCRKCGGEATPDPPYSSEARARWPVPDAVKGASAVDAFMWYAAEGMDRIFPDTPHTEFYNDFSGHRLRCGSLTLTLDWSDHE